jgi:hypothetical protein
MTTDQEITGAPVPVSIVNPEALIPASLKKHHLDYSFRTIVLRAALAGQDAVGTSIRPLCSADLSRRLLIVQAWTNDVVLCETQARAQDPANAVTGLPNPEGYVLRASVTDGVQQPPVYIPGTGMIWVTAASFPATITAILLNKVDG